MKIYISGSITGNPDYKKQFSDAATKLRNAGHQVLDPTVWNREGLKLEYEEYMRIDLAMLDVADAIFMIPGWQNSKGGRIEYWRAKRKGKVVLTDYKNQE